MTNLNGTQYPDFSTLQTELLDILSPLRDRAELRVQFPPSEFDVSADKPTITVSIKTVSIYNAYAKNSPFPVTATVSVGVYVPKSSDSSLCYTLFSEVARLLLESALSLKEISCDELEYIPDLRHYCLRLEAKLKPFDTKEENDGNTDL